MTAPALSGRRHWLLGLAGLLALLGLWWSGVRLFGGDGLGQLFSPQATLASLGELSRAGWLVSRRTFRPSAYIT